MSDGIEAGELCDAATSEVWDRGETAPTTATPRRKKQPTAAAMREQLALAAVEKIRLLGLLDDALEMTTVRKLVVVAVIVGFALGRFIP